MTNFVPAALVTGANKGIGFEIVRQLSRQFKGTVYLTARDLARGQTAEQTFRSEGLLNVVFLQMDVTDKGSVEKVRNFVKEKHDGLDILINNAGVYLWQAGSDLVPDESAEAVKKTIATNFTGLLEVCTAFFPILRAHARVVNVSSTTGTLRLLKSVHLKKQLVSESLTISQLQEIIDDYTKIAVRDKSAALDAGYPTKFGPYAMSKIAVTALSRVQQRAFDHDQDRVDIVVNACCPGLVATDMNNHSGPKTVYQGAETPVYLALLAPSVMSERVKPRGEFVYEKTVFDWAGDELPKEMEKFLFF